MPSPSKTQPLSDTEIYILNAIQELSYGSVEISIHDSKIVQIEKREKVRFDPSSNRKDQSAKTS